MPAISIIVPVYKVELYLKRCIDSILVQSFSDFELILIDDGSPDRCPAICDEYALKDNRIRVIHQANGGLSAARNAGIDWAITNSNSEWLNFIDSDDWVHPKYLEVLYSAANNNYVDASACEIAHTEGKNTYVNEDDLSSQILSTEIYYVKHCGNFTMVPAKLYKKTLFFDIRYPIGKLNEDALTTHKVLFKSENIAWIKEPLYFYFFNPCSIMNSKWTPKRLAAVEARKEQIEYFRIHGYRQAEQQAIFMYLYRLETAIMQSKEYPEINKALIKEMCIAIEQYKNVVPIYANEHFYMHRYPIRARIVLYYRLSKGMLEKQGILKTVNHVAKKIVFWIKKTIIGS